MREIKFRAWFKGEMITQPINSPFGASKLFGFLDANGINEFDKVMQCTGLKDKNGIDVYEGDVCKFYECEDEYLFFHGLAYMNDDRIGGSWKIIRCDNVHPELPDYKGESILDSTAFWNDDFEIIGNIYESPELLEDLT